jgi:anaerobic ribonucleoside-triphosphate reductase
MPAGNERLDDGPNRREALITPTFSICPNHGYLAGRRESCPTRGAVSEVYSRVVGYLRPVNQENEGKVEDFKQRKTFKIAQGV